MAEQHLQPLGAPLKVRAVDLLVAAGLCLAPGRLILVTFNVLPLLRGDRIVGRADLKSDRKAGELRVLDFHREPGVRDTAALQTAFRRALQRLARTAGLERVRLLEPAAR